MIIMLCDCIILSKYLWISSTKKVSREYYTNKSNVSFTMHGLHIDFCYLYSNSYNNNNVNEIESVSSISDELLVAKEVPKTEDFLLYLCLRSKQQQDDLLARVILIW